MSDEQTPPSETPHRNWQDVIESQLRPDFEVGAFLKEWLRTEVKNGNLAEMPIITASHPYADPKEKKSLTISHDDLVKLDEMLRDGNIDSGDGHLVHFTSGDESMLLRLTEILNQKGIIFYHLNQVFDGENKQEVSVLFLPEVSPLLTMAKERWREKNPTERKI